MQPVLFGYLPILVFLVIAGGIAIAMVAGSILAARQKPYPEKLSAYECGFEAFDVHAVVSMFGITLSRSFSSSSTLRSRSYFLGPSL
jgi:NADH:ubiquinone oxidoreductase subunit 3 (subunit A)